jgi:Ser/Thr protein kinase RdoA (MazF antagonist)
VGHHRLASAPRTALGRPEAGSEDIPKIISLLTELSEIPAPDILTRTARGYWERYADDPSALDGDGVVHHDPNPTNFVNDGDRAWMVDFGWCIRGPAWMTSANLIVSMMEAGWKAAEADNALKAVPAWVSAPRHAVDQFARATVLEWNQLMERRPVHEVWQFRAAIARSWAEYREHAACA